MGTFTQITIEGTDESTLSVDFESPIYRHKYYHDSKSNYLFKIDNIGWVLSETASPLTADIDDIQLTCFEDNIIDCLKYRWFWGYNDNKYPILSLSITIGACHIDMCLENFEMTITQSNNAPANKGILNGHLTPISRTEPCTLDSAVCNSNRTYWINNDETNYRWYYRVTKNANWVYGKVGSDRIACAPGYVEAPLFCTTFVYASNNYTNYTFKGGLCNPTASPTVQPSIAPSIQPSASPTPAPTDIPYCAKDYVFNPVPRNTTITMDCPFGWWGTSITRHCDMEAEWHMISDDCHLLSFTDDFSYFRDELWMNNDENTLQTYMTVTYPLRIHFAGYMDTSGACGTSTIALMDGNASSLSVEWNCDAISASLGNVSTSQAIVSNASVRYLDGYLLYRNDYNGDIALSVVQNMNSEALNLLDTQWLPSSQSLFLRLLPITGPRIGFTSFIDWFNPPQTNVFSALWTAQTSNVTFGTYVSDAFMHIDPDTNRNYVQLSNGGSISSDATQFQFIPPFSISMLLLHNLSYDTTITVATSTSKHTIPFDTNTYPSLTVAFRISSDYLYITVDGTEHNQMYTNCTGTEVYATMDVTEYNVSIAIYDADMNTCGVLTHNNASYLQSSSLNWHSLHISPTTLTDISGISYIGVVSGIEQEIITPSPTELPTITPTRDPDSYACVNPTNTSIRYFEDDSFTIPCAYGYKGSADSYTCMQDGTFTVMTGCYTLSFGDEFILFNPDLWDVIEPSYVNGRTALDHDNQAIEFTPNHPAYVSVMRSVHPVVYPLKIRTTVSKRSNECNNWFIAIGSSYAPRASSSILLQWDCVSHEARLYNSSYKRFDKNCWGSDEADIAQNLNESLDVTLTLTNTKAIAYFDTINCANLIVQTADLYNSGDKPFIWFGTHTDHGDEDAIVARFSNLLYTQFYTDFDGRMTSIWRSEPQETDSNAEHTILYGEDAPLIAGDSYMFEVPFMVELGIKRPWNNEIMTITDTGIEEVTIQKGRYAHFIVFGSSEYANEARDNVIQIVYDSKPRQRMVYSSNGVYADSKGCKWGIYGKTFDITIQIDAGIVSVSDSFCGKTLYAKHESEFEPLMAMGMVALDDYYTVDDFIAFDRIEVYQLPIVYRNMLLIEEDISLSNTRSVADLYNLNPTFWDESLFGFGMMYWVIAGSVLLILLCGFFCMIAWCLNLCCFKKAEIQKQQKKKKKKRGHEAIGSVSPAVVEPSSAPIHERFETGMRFSDAEFRQINEDKDGGNPGHVVQSTDTEEREEPGSPPVKADDPNVHPSYDGPGSPPAAVQVYVPPVHKAQQQQQAVVMINAAAGPGPRPFVHNPQPQPVVHQARAQPPNLMIRNTNDPPPSYGAPVKAHDDVQKPLIGATPGIIKKDGRHSPAAAADVDDDDDIVLDDLDGLVTNETDDAMKAKLQKEKAMKAKYQRELFWQRQFFEMVMLDPEQQATLAALAPPQRRLYLEQEMRAYVALMNTEEEDNALTVQDIPDDYVQQQMERINSTFDEHGEGLLDETEAYDVFEMVKNQPAAQQEEQQQGGRSSQRIMNQLNVKPAAAAAVAVPSNKPLSPQQVAQLQREEQLSARYMGQKKVRQHNSASLFQMGQEASAQGMHHPKHNSAQLYNMGQQIHREHPQHKSMDMYGMGAAMNSPAMIRLQRANEQHVHQPPPAMMHQPAAALQVPNINPSVPHIIDQNDENAFMIEPNSMAEDTPPLALDSGKNTFALYHYKLPSQPKLPDGFVELGAMDPNKKEKRNDAPYID